MQHICLCIECWDESFCLVYWRWHGEYLGTLSLLKAPENLCNNSSQEGRQTDIQSTNPIAKHLRSTAVWNFVHVSPLNVHTYKFPLMVSLLLFFESLSFFFLLDEICSLRVQYYIFLFVG